jgi:hypothetical protein
MADKQKTEMKNAEIFAVKAQAWSLLLEKSFPYFKCSRLLVLTYLLEPSGVTAMRGMLKLFGVN